SKHFLSHYQIELKKGTEAFVTITTTTSTTTRIFGVESEIDYQVRVKTVSINGIISDGVSSSVVTTLGKAAPPSDVTGFDANQLGGQIHFTWNAAPDVDLARYIIKKGSEWSSGDVIAELVDLTEFDYPVGEIGTVVYMIKAIDTSGNESANPAIDVIIQTTPPEM
ncbi:MAG: hypothetical protein CUN57_01470, partial [Phototrophicales bacterium]